MDQEFSSGMSSEGSTTSEWSGSSGTDTDVKQKAQETASTLVDQAAQVANTQVMTQKERAASTLDSVAESLRQAGSSMREQQPQMASLTDQAASRVEDLSSYVRDHDISDLVAEAENFARREPWLFLGGAFAIGFAAARFMKASSTAAYQPSGSTNGYGTATTSASTSTSRTKSSRSSSRRSSGQ